MNPGLTPTQRRTLSWAGLALVAGLLMWLLAPVLTPFLVSAVVAYALTPAVDRLVAWRLPRALAALVVELALIVVLLAVALLIVPIVAREVPQVRDQLPQIAERLNTQVAPWLAAHGVDVALDTASIKAFALKYLNANMEDWSLTVLNSARIGGSIALAVVGNLVLIPVVLFYFLNDWPNLIAWARALVPPRMLPAVDGFARECDMTLGQYLRGQLLVMVVLAVLYSIGLALFRFELAVPVGVFTGLAVFIPYVGFGLGLVLALMAAILQFGDLYGLVAVAVVYGVGQVVESFFLTPRLVGERIGMNPLTVIFALLAFGQLFGFAGVLIALPVSAVLVVAMRRVREAYLGSRLYRGADDGDIVDIDLEVANADVDIADDVAVVVPAGAALRVHPRDPGA